MNGTHNNTSHNTSEITLGAYTKLGKALLPKYSRGCYSQPIEGKKSKILSRLPKCIKKGPATAAKAALKKIANLRWGR